MFWIEIYPTVKSGETESWGKSKRQELLSIHALRETSVHLDTHLRGLCSVTLMGLFVKVNGKLQKDLLFLSRHKPEH